MAGTAGCNSVWRLACLSMLWYQSRSTGPKHVVTFVEVVSVLEELIGVAPVKHVPVPVRLCLIALCVGLVVVGGGGGAGQRATLVSTSRLRH